MSSRKRCSTTCPMRFGDPFLASCQPSKCFVVFVEARHTELVPRIEGHLYV